MSDKFGTASFFYGGYIMYNLNSKTKLKWIFALFIAFFMAITGFIFSVSIKSAINKANIHFNFVFEFRLYII